MTAARLCGLIIFALVSVTPTVAQVATKNPAFPAHAAYVQIDDELFDVGDRVPNGDGKILPLGATVDSKDVTWLAKYNGWEAGVVPVEFAPTVTPVRREMFMRICNEVWAPGTMVLCTPHTSQLGYLFVDDRATTCVSPLGQARRQVRYTMNLGSTCWTNHTVAHELGHVFGFIHEHQRPDRDTYITILPENVVAGALGNFTKVTSLTDPPGEYDLASIMHYPLTAFGIDSNHPSMRVNDPYLGQAQSDLGNVPLPSALDKAALLSLSMRYYRPLPEMTSTPTRAFDRNDFLDAMERLDAFYRSPLGLARTNGLSIDGRPDLLGIATGIFDIYLAARSAGLSEDLSFGHVVNELSRSSEWRTRHPTWIPGTRGAIAASVTFDRNEFLKALQDLDAFYSSPEGLQRPAGLSISGSPDFEGIATWIFDVYLNARLAGVSASESWTRVLNAIRATDEWRSVHFNSFLR